MAEDKLCTNCTEIVKQECDPLCEEQNTTDCIIHEAAIACLDIEAGATLADILSAICTLATNGSNVAVESTEHDGNDACPQGGVIVVIGIDDNGDGTVDTPLTTFNLCNGDDGASQAISVEYVAPGINCLKGGVSITVDGDTYYICNGLDGVDGQDGFGIDAVMEGVDFSCLTALGVTVGDTATEQMQTLVNLICNLLGTAGSTISIQDHDFTVAVGQTLQVNLLTGSVVIGETVTAITLGGTADGYVSYDYDPAVPVNGILEITGTSVGIETRTYTITTNISGVTAASSITITVVEALSALDLYNDNPADKIRIERYDDFVGIGLGTGYWVYMNFNPILGNADGVVFTNFFLSVSTSSNCSGGGSHSWNYTIPINTNGSITPVSDVPENPSTLVGGPIIVINLCDEGTCPNCNQSSYEALVVTLHGDLTINGNPINIPFGTPNFQFILPPANVKDASQLIEFPNPNA